MKHSVRLSRIAALCLLASAGAVHAADVSSASFSLQGLRYKLIDLAPDDGITPGLTISGTWMGSEAIQNEGDYYPSSRAVFTDQPVTLFGTEAAVTRSSSNGSVNFSLGGDSVGMTTTLSTTPVDMSNAVQTTDYSYTVQDESGQWYIQTSRETSVNLAPQRVFGGGSLSLNTDLTDYSVQAAKITLTPNTLLLIEGTASFDMSADRTSLVNQATALNEVLGEDAQYKSLQANGKLYSNARIALLRSGFQAEGTQEGGYVTYLDGGTVFTMDGHMYYNDKGFTDMEVYGYEEGVAYDEALTSSRPFSKDLVLSYVNSSGDSQDLALGIDFTSSLEEYLYAYGYKTELLSLVPTDAPEIPDPVVVPEPGTYALMGLGLLGLGLVRRRHAMDA